ncbi:MAG: hypothetical protein K2G03_00315 [Bacilli bacterium]|nr:hypothetical protein [Bacilli bacterium]
MMKFIKGQYADYVKFNGEKFSNSPLALTIKENECDYYLVYKDENMFSDVVVFPKENNLINLNITLNIEEIFIGILEELKNYYSYLTFSFDANNDKVLELVREKGNVVDEYTEKVYDEYNMTYIKVNL